MGSQGPVSRARLSLFLVLFFDGTVRLQDIAQGVNRPGF